jgi:GNAT superfamily N-acetyltransferase
MTVTVLPFSPELEADFYALHGPANEAGWCYCVAWWVSTWDGWNQRTAAENRRLRQSLLDQGQHDGYLLYVDGQPAGWCQAGPRDRLTLLVRRYQLPPDPETWALTCFFIAPSFRRQGLAGRLLHGVLADLAARGVKRVEAYPKRGQELDEVQLWTGPEAMFLGAGFEVAQDDPRRPILARSLEDLS